MIAYNHYIKFIPELKNSKKGEGSYSDIVNIEEKPFHGLHEKLLFMMTFLNNQGRDICLYTDINIARAHKEKGKIDLLVEDGEHYLIIENKLSAIDQPRQISRYKPIDLIR